MRSIYKPPARNDPGTEDPRRREIVDRSRCADHICYGIRLPEFVEVEFVLAYTVNPRFCRGDATEDGESVSNDCVRQS